MWVPINPAQHAKPQHVRAQSRSSLCLNLRHCAPCPGRFLNREAFSCYAQTKARRTKIYRCESQLFLVERLSLTVS